MLKVFEAFAGIGFQRLALDRVINYESVGISEIDKYAIKSYEALHGKTCNYGDITKIDPHQLPDFDLFTYSFPCQDISNAGHQKGLIEGTRSGLLWECERIINIKRPTYLLMENVTMLLSKKFRDNYRVWENLLEEMGYRNYTFILNCADYGVPQKRKRAFTVSILNNIHSFKIPDPFDNGIKLIDILENDCNINEMYYLSYSSIKNLILNNNINTRYNYNNKVVEIVVDDTLIIKEGTKKGYAIAGIGDSIDFSYPSSTTRRGRVINGLSHTILTSPNIAIISTNRIRRITPLEVWRLFGGNDNEYYKIRPINSDTQLYKQMGNGIPVNMLLFIFKELFKEVK